MIRQIFDQAVDLLYPHTCNHCGRVGRAWCEHCRAVLEAYPFTLAERELDSGLHVLSVGPHEGLLRDAIHAFKFDGARELAELLGAALDDGLIQAQIEIDVVVPVPLHERRFRWRGYNQAALLADVVAANMGVPHEPLLSRTRYTGTQVGRDAIARREAVDGAFAADAAELNARRVLLIDDVVTTGSTLMACADALRDAGALSVIAACVANA
jgi:ComF family protein